MVDHVLAESYRQYFKQKFINRLLHPRFRCLFSLPCYLCKDTDYIRLEQRPLLYLSVKKYSLCRPCTVWSRSWQVYCGLVWPESYIKLLMLDSVFPPLPFQSVLPTGLSNAARASLASGLQPVNKPLCHCQDPNSIRTNQPVGNTSPLTSVTNQCKATVLGYWSRHLCALHRHLFEIQIYARSRQVDLTRPLLWSVTSPHQLTGKVSIGLLILLSHGGQWTQEKLETR